MKVRDKKLRGVKVIEPDVFADGRGFFLETYQEKRYREHGIEARFVQDNHSRSERGVLRGLHFQVTKPQGKLVSCLEGEVFDVVVDIDRSSPTYGQWVGEVISGENKKQVWVPPGYAHGFLVLSESADFVYKCTDYYDPSDQACLIWNDETVNVEWPLETPPILSDKDKQGLRLNEL